MQQQITIPLPDKKQPLLSKEEDEMLTLLARMFADSVIKKVNSKKENNVNLVKFSSHDTERRIKVD